VPSAARGVDVNAILAANLFGTSSTSSAPVAALPLSLLGTFARAASAYGYAVIKTGATDAEQLYVVGSTLPGGGVLREVYTDHVVVEQNGIMAMLPLQKPQAGAALFMASAQPSDTTASMTLDHSYDRSQEPASVSQKTIEAPAT
jgi:type II secretory pathway component PulC